MGCKQSTLRTETPVVASAVAPKPASVSVAPVLAAEEVTVVKATSASPRTVEEPTPAVDDVLAEIFANQEQVATAASPRAESVKAASPMRLGTRAPSTLNVASAASPKKEEVAPAMEDKPAAISFSEFLAQQENTVAPTTSSKGQKSDSKPRKVLFDAETMRKSAPKNQTHAAVPSTKLTKKQQLMVKKQHVSVGRRGPVASRFEKGSKSQMQTDVYLQMASAFERLLTNADTINAHLDTR